MNPASAVSSQGPEYTPGPQTRLPPIASKIFTVIGLIFASAPLLSLIVTIPPLTPWIIAINGLALFVLGLILKQPDTPPRTEYSPAEVEDRLRVGLALASFEIFDDNPQWGRASAPLTPIGISQHFNTYDTTPVAASHSDGTDVRIFSSFFVYSIQIGSRSGTIHSTYTIAKEGLNREEAKQCMSSFRAFLADEIKGNTADVYNALVRAFAKFQNQFNTLFSGAVLSFSFVFIFDGRIWTASSGREQVYFMNEGALKISVSNTLEIGITCIPLQRGYLVMTNLACIASPSQLHTVVFPPQPLVFPEEGPAKAHFQHELERLRTFLKAKQATHRPQDDHLVAFFNRHRPTMTATELAVFHPTFDPSTAGCEEILSHLKIYHDDTRQVLIANLKHINSPPFQRFNDDTTWDMIGDAFKSLQDSHRPLFQDSPRMEQLRPFIARRPPIDTITTAQAIADRISRLDPRLPATVMIVDLSRTAESAPVEE